MTSIPPTGPSPIIEQLPAPEPLPRKTPPQDPNREDQVFVLLSPEAIAAMGEPPPAPLSRLSLLFPTRDGSLVTGLATGASGMASSSQGKSFEEVAADARARMDARYAAMESRGPAFDPHSPQDRDANTLMGGLDRRSLYAVASNAEGRFSQDEQDMARRLMARQEQLAMGVYSGPGGLESAYFNPLEGRPPSEQPKLHAAFLDKVGDEEKASAAWAYGRANAQAAYETMAAQEGNVPETRTVTPLVDLIMQAMAAHQDDPERGRTVGQIRSFADLRSQPWMEGFLEAFDELAAASAA